MQDSDVKELFSAIRILKDKMDKVVDLVENVEKQIKELKKEDLAQKENSKKILDPYSKSNFIDRGDYIELVTPLVVVDENCKKSYIKAIQKSFSEISWHKAMDYAKELRLGGFDDWRVPTKEELYEIYKIRNISGIRTSKDVFWSSSTGARGTSYAWLVCFDYGDVGDSYKTNDYYVRCVR